MIEFFHAYLRASLSAPASLTVQFERPIDITWIKFDGWIEPGGGTYGSSLDFEVSAGGVVIPVIPVGGSLTNSTTILKVVEQKNLQLGSIEANQVTYTREKAVPGRMMGPDLGIRVGLLFFYLTASYEGSAHTTIAFART